MEEKIYYTLTDGERDSIATLIAMMLGELGDENQIAQFSEFKSKLGEYDIERFGEIKDVLESKNLYPQVTNLCFLRYEEELLVSLLCFIDQHPTIEDGKYNYEISTTLGKL